MILQRSLTLRLSCFFSVAIMVVVSILYLFISYSVEQHFAKEEKKVLLNKIKLIHKQINDPHFNQDYSLCLNEIERHDGFILKVRQNNQTLYSSSEVNYPDRFFSNNDVNTGELIQWNSAHAPFHGMKFSIASQDSSAAPYTLILARSMKANLSFLESFKSILKDLILTVGIVTALLSWFITYRGLYPLKTLRDQARVISMQDIHQRMPVDDLPQEIAALSITLNKMLDRLENAFSELSHFSSDIAHELRTPINNLMMQTQVSLSQPRTPLEYRNILSSNSEEYAHLARMISDMLLLAKVENEPMLHTTEMIKLDQELLTLVDFYDALAEENQVSFEIQGKATVQGDKLMLKRAFNNLISNAVRHAFKNTVITISIAVIKHDVVVHIGNQGKTIAPDDLKHLFERFYRADKSRTHGNEDNVGLGLAIAQSIAKAHNGDLQASSEDNKTVFTLTIKEGPY